MVKLHQLLDPYVIRKLNKIRGPSLQSKPQVKEPVAKRAAGSFHLSDRELHELMDTRRQTYKRVGGRVRGK